MATPKPIQGAVRSSDGSDRSIPRLHQYELGPSIVEVATGKFRLMRGHEGQGVQALQRALNERGAGLTPDGLFGGGTERAVVAFQRSRGLEPTGEADVRTLEALGVLVALPRGREVDGMSVSEAALDLGTVLRSDTTLAPTTSRGALDPNARRAETPARRPAAVTPSTPPATSTTPEPSTSPTTSAPTHDLSTGSLPWAGIEGINPPPHPEAARLAASAQIGSDATPYARRAISIMLSQLGVYGGDAAVLDYNGGGFQNWCKAFGVWGYSQTGQSVFQNPREALQQHRKTEQHVMTDYAKTFSGRGGTGRAYRPGNAGPLVSTTPGHLTFNPHKPSDGDLTRTLPYRPKVGDMVDIVTDKGSGHSVIVINTDNWPMIQTIEGNTLDVPRARAEGRTEIIGKSGAAGGMVGIKTHDMRSTPVICVWDMSLSEREPG